MNKKHRQHSCTPPANLTIMISKLPEIVKLIHTAWEVQMLSQITNNSILKCEYVNINKAVGCLEPATFTCQYHQWNGQDNEEFILHEPATEMICLKISFQNWVNKANSTILWQVKLCAPACVPLQVIKRPNFKLKHHRHCQDIVCSAKLKTLGLSSTSAFAMIFKSLVIFCA